VRFAYQENGRLTVHVNVAGTSAELKHEITRDNSMTSEQLDAWRLYITGQQNAEDSHISASDDTMTVDEL
jgi:hypothetical protein